MLFDTRLNLYDACYESAFRRGMHSKDNSIKFHIQQLFFEIEVNILPLFTEIEKNDCFSIYTGSDLNNFSEGNH